MTLLSTDWGLAWGMAGISVGVVFTILILLVCVLYVFSAVAKGSTAKAEAAAKPKVLTGAEYVRSKQADIAGKALRDIERRAAFSPFTTWITPLGTPS